MPPYTCDLTVKINEKDHLTWISSSQVDQQLSWELPRD
jgi:hypothetical protein